MIQYFSSKKRCVFESTTGRLMKISTNVILWEMKQKLSKRSVRFTDYSIYFIVICAYYKEYSGYITHRRKEKFMIDNKTYSYNKKTAALHYRCTSYESLLLFDINFGGCGTILRQSHDFTGDKSAFYKLQETSRGCSKLEHSKERLTAGKWEQWT